MHRFHLPPDQCQGDLLVLTEREAHHGLHVIRLRPGEPAVVLDGAGGHYLCETREFSRRSITLRVVQRTKVPPLPWRISLLQAIPKGKMLEEIVQKATELGAHRIVPILSERVVAQWDEGKAGHKLEKLRQVAIEAIKQCGSAWLPQIEPPALLQGFLGRRESFDLSLVGSLQGDGRQPREWLKEHVREHQRPPKSVAAWVGPEGDFTPAELGALKTAGARPITLGRLVLRSDTAAICCLAVLSDELQSLQS